MSDGTVKVMDDDGTVRLIDNDVLTVDGKTVMRQRVATTPAASIKAAEGKFFLTDTGQMSTTLANNWAAATFENPDGSGKTARILRVTIESDTTAWGRFYRGPTANLPATVKTPHNAINLLSTGPYASAMLVKGDPVAAEMDNPTTLTSRVTNNTGVPLKLPPLTITEGMRVGFAVNLGGTANVSIAIYWYEE